MSRVMLFSCFALLALAVGVVTSPLDREKPEGFTMSRSPFEDAFDSTRPIVPIPPPEDSDARVVALRRRLFHEKRLSADGTISCASPRMNST